MFIYALSIVFAICCRHGDWSAIGLSTQNGAVAFVTAVGVCPACHTEALRRWEPS